MISNLLRHPLRLCVSAVILFAGSARAQTLDQITTTNVLQSATNYIIADNSVTIERGKGKGFLADIKTGGATNVVEFKIQFSPDLVLWATNSQTIITLNAQTNLTWSTNFPPALTDNQRYARLYSIGTVNTNKITNAVYWMRHVP